MFGQRSIADIGQRSSYPIDFSEALEWQKRYFDLVNSKACARRMVAEDIGLSEHPFSFWLGEEGRDRP